MHIPSGPLLQTIDSPDDLKKLPKENREYTKEAELWNQFRVWNQIITKQKLILKLFGEIPKIILAYPMLD